MKAMILFCAAAFLTGCAHNDYDSRGMAPRQSGFESGTHFDSELPYRAGPGLNGTDRQIPSRSGPGGLGKSDY